MVKIVISGANCNAMEIFFFRFFFSADLARQIYIVGRIVWHVCIRPVGIVVYLFCCSTVSTKQFINLRYERKYTRANVTDISLAQISREPSVCFCHLCHKSKRNVRQFFFLLIFRSSFSFALFFPIGCGHSRQMISSKNVTILTNLFQKETKNSRCKKTKR